MIEPRLLGRVALVTGADSVLGTATALRLAREGAILVLNDLVSTRLEGVATEIREVEGGESLIVLGDLARAAHVDRMLRETLEAFGRIDVLVNMAGGDPEGALRCAAACAERVLPAMRERRQGRVLSVSPASLAAAAVPGAESPHAGLAALTRKLALEVAADGITVNGVVPGLVVAPAEADVPAPASTTALIPMGRVGDAREVAAVLAFLASDEAAYVTGQVLHVDGGLSLAG